MLAWRQCTCLLPRLGTGAAQQTSFHSLLLRCIFTLIQPLCIGASYGLVLIWALDEKDLGTSRFRADFECRLVGTCFSF